MERLGEAMKFSLTELEAGTLTDEMLEQGWPVA